MSDKLHEMLKRHEGYKTELYRCTAGKLTIGVGWNIQDRGLPEHVIDILLDYAIAENRALLLKHEWFRSLSGVRKDVIMDMAFMGIGSLLEFKKMIEALKGNRFTEAASEMLSSKWAQQVGDRALELAAMMITDKYQKQS